MNRPYKYEQGPITTEEDDEILARIWDSLDEPEWQPLANAFCPTGKGGGVDPTCSPSNVLDSKVGDTLIILNKPVKVVDFGTWKEMRAKYPQSVDKALSTLPQGMSEDKLGRTWVLQDEQGEHWLAGKAGLKMFAKTYSAAAPHKQKSAGKEDPGEVDWDRQFPRAGDTVDGREVGEDIPNTESISASLNEYEVLPGVREVKMFEGMTGKHYSVQGTQKIKQLAESIKRTKQITPLIVVTDGDPKNDYILEGSTRIEALHLVGAKSFPALVVVDTEAFEERVSGKVDNAFCPTGKGGGIDPTCTPGNKGKVTDSKEFKEWFGKSKVVDAQGRPKVVYHGTTADVDFDEFREETSPYANLDEMLGAHFAEDKQISESFVKDRQQGRLYPVYLSIEKPRIAPQGKMRSGEIEHDAYAIERDILDTVMPHEKELFVQWVSKARRVSPEEGAEIFDRLSKGESIGADEYNGVVGFEVDSEMSRDKEAHPVAQYLRNFDSRLNELSESQRRGVVQRYKQLMVQRGYDGIKYINTAPNEIAEVSSENRTCWIPFSPNQIKSALSAKKFDRKSSKIINVRLSENE